jgi:hypothetical protein
VKFIRLTDTFGRDVWIFAQWVTRVTYPIAGQQAQAARAVVWMGTNQQAVIETPEAVVKMIEASDGS